MNLSIPDSPPNELVPQKSADLLQKSFAFSVSSDSVAPMRFAMEAVDDGAAQS